MRKLLIIIFLGVIHFSLFAEAIDPTSKMVGKYIKVNGSDVGTLATSNYFTVRRNTYAF